MSRQVRRASPSLRFAGTALFALCASTSVVYADDTSTSATTSVPILFDDSTVRARPAILKKERVLAALVRGHEIYVPLRSMFERMGAFVSASADGKTIYASKNGASVSVTVGVAKVVINGETRPLDVPPMTYRGVVLVPVRVMSEALGAYVQWVPDRRIVVVRYFTIAPTPAPATPAPVLPAPTLAPTLPSPAPVPTTTAAPAIYYPRAFVQGAFAEPRNYNEFSAGKYCPESYTLTAGYIFKDSNFAVKGDFREDAYATSDDVQAFGNHYTRFATIDGGVALSPVFLARQSSLDGRLEYQIAAPRIYLGVGVLHDTTNYGYPSLNAVGFGVEKLSSLRPGVDLSGSLFYYPSADGGTYTIADATSPNFDKTYAQRFAVLKYDVGVGIVFAHSPVYLAGGFEGERYSVHRDAPIGQSHDGPYLGLGVKL